jgi:kynurenine formamidase
MGSTTRGASMKMFAMSYLPRNWNRWGADDQRGTLNYITAEKRLQASKLIRSGKVYSLAIPLRSDAPIWPTRHKNWHIATHRNTLGPGPGGAEDVLMMHTHGTTHIDALCHVFRDGQMYNGYSTAETITSHGAERNSISNVDAIATRGVLLDLPKYHGVAHLTVDHEITPEEVEAVAAAQGVTLGCGDALLLRTGFMQVWKRDAEEYDRAQPGVNHAVAQWAGEREIVLLGADNSAVEIFPTQTYLPVHQEFIRDQGGYLLELLYLDELARDQVYEFMLVVAPLRIDRGLGSPINPIALV